MQTLKFFFGLFVLLLMLALNSRGFNLFTALVSFLLIMLAVLLIMSMIQTERTASDTVAKIESRSRLEATAEMARADAMQVFNYALRKKIEDWLTDPERGGLTLQLQNKTWLDIQREFAESKFGGEQGSQFARFTASSLEGIFYSPSHFGNYTISLEGSSTLEPGLRDAIAKSLDDFFTVIECPSPGDPKNCKKGTFYVNLHLERLSQEEYERLPKLHVVDRATGEELKEIVLPRAAFRIYVPLRFFKAIAEAKALTHFPLEAPVDGSGDIGLFSPGVHNEIETFALGMCDFGSCAPRDNPLEPSLNAGFEGTNAFCPGDSLGGLESWSDGLSVPLECRKYWCGNEPKLVGAKYNANNNGGDSDWKSMRDTLALVASARVCEVLKDAKRAGYIDAMPGDKFALVGNRCEENGKMLAYDISVNVDARDSKLIGTPSTSGKAVPAGNGPGRSLGLFLNAGEVDFPHINVSELDCSDSEGQYKSRCAEVKSIKVTLAFREEDPNYMVREAKPGDERIYRISVYDSTYVPFTANWNQGTMGSGGLYYSAPAVNGCSMASGKGWNCFTKQEPSAPLSKALQPVGCLPG